MKKHLLTVVCLLMFCFGIKAQISAYTFTQTTGTYASITGNTDLFGTTWDDNVSLPLALGFNFNFNGIPYSSVTVNSNGHITFGTTPSAVTEINPISSSTAFDGAVVAFGRDLISGASASGVSYVSTGTAPNRQFIIQWTNARRSNSGTAVTGDVLNFQIVLNETSNKIDIIYGTCSATSTSNSNKLQVGLRGITNADYNDLSGGNNTAWNAFSAGTANSSTVNFKSTVVPASGLTFSWLASTAVNGLAVTPTAAQCTATLRNVTANVIPGYPALTGVTLNYSFNGVAQTPIAMTGGNLSTASVWNATIPAATPVNANVTWSVLAISATNTITAAGTSYQDAQLTGLTATAMATPNPVCAGSTTSLSALPPVIATIGAGTLTTTNSGLSGGNSVSPYSHYFGGGRFQYLIRATELTAQGITAGNLSSVAFDVTAIGTTYNGFAVNVAQTANANLSGGFVGGLTQVYSGNPTPVVGINTYSFSSPYNWDGVSNLVIQICWSNNNTGGIASEVKYDNTTYVSEFFNRQDNQTPATECSATGNTGSNSARPKMIIGQNKAAGLTFAWSDGTTMIGTTNPLAVIPAVNTTYSATLTDANGCSITTSPVTVTITSLPSAPTVTNSTQCGNGIPTAMVGGGTSYNWYASATSTTVLQSGTSQTYTSTIVTTTTLYVSVVVGACESPRSAVTANVTQPDAITATTSAANICPSGSATLTAVQSGSTNTYTFAWVAVPSAGSGMPTSVSGASVNVSPTTAGTYIYSVTATDGLCSTSSSVAVTLSNPPPVSVIASPTVICSGSPVTLNAAIASSGTAAIGTTTTNLTGSTSQPTAFCNRWPSYRMQTVYTAAELTAAGLHAGNITSMAYKIIDLGDAATNANFTVKCGTTTATSFTDFIVSTGFTTVFPSATYTHSVGVNVIPFSTPFNWDGVSNLVIEVNQDGANLTNNSQTYYTPTAGNTVAYSYSGGSSGTPSMNRLNVVFGGLITQSSADITWQWNPGAINSGTTTVNPVNTGTVPATQFYTVTATNTITTCSSTATLGILVNDVPVLPTAFSTTQCGLGIPTASVSGGATYNWYATPTSTTVLQSGASANFTTAVNATTTWYVSSYNTNCESGRTALTQTVTIPDAVTASSSSSILCPGNTATLTVVNTGSTNVYSYTWTATPALGSGIPTTATGATTAIAPTTTGNYVYLVTASDGICTTTASINVGLINPPSIIATANPTMVCSGSNVSLNATTNIIATGTVAIGTGTTATATSDELTAFCNRRQNYRMQTVFTAAELSAAGLYAGNITAISYKIISVGSNSVNTNFVVKCGTTTATAFTDYISNTGFTTVVPATSYTHAPGVNMITFNTPYNWDGVSNLVIEMTHDGVDLSDNADTYYTTTAGNTVAYGYNSPTSGTPSKKRLNIVFSGQTVAQGAGSLTWQWNPGAINSNTTTVAPVNTGTTASTASYTISGTDPVTTCSNTAIVTVTVNPVPTAPVAYNSTQCGFGIPTASVTGSGGTYNWYATAASTTVLQAGASATYTTAVNTSTTFYVSEFNGSCESPRTVLTVTVTTPDAVTASVSQATACPLSAVTLSTTQTGSTNVYTYTWTASPAGSGITSSVTGASVMVTPTASGAYQYTVIASDGTCSTISTVGLTVNAAPLTPTISPLTPSICAGGSTTLTAISNSAAFVFGTQANQNTAAAVSTDYPAPYTAYYGGQRMQTLILASELSAQGFTAGSPFTDVQFPVVSKGSSAVCNGFQVSIGASSLTSLTAFQPGLSQVVAPFSYTPSVGANVHSFSTPFIWDGTSNIILETTFSDNLFGTANYSVTQYNSPTPFQSTIVYRSDNVTPAAAASATGINYSYNARPDLRLTSVSNVTFTWSPSTGLSSATGSSVTANPSATTVYTVTADNGSCTSSKVFTLTVNPIPTVSISASTSSLCSGTSASLTASGATTYSWMPAGGTATVAVVSPTTTTVYTVTGTSLGCSSTQTVNLNVTATPTVVASASPSVICAGATVSLTASGATTYTWSPISVLSSSATVTPTTNTTYSVTGSTAGCASTKTVNVTVNHVPTLTVSASSSALCTGATATLIATGTSTAYAWSNGVTTASTAVTPSVNTTYSITGTNICGTSTSSITINVNSLPTLTAATSAATICTGNAAVLTVTGTATSYSWSTGATTMSITVTPTTTTNYSVTGTSSCGTVTVTVVQNVALCTGIESMMSSDEISMYPNPTHDQVNITIGSYLASNNTTVEITDALGKLVMKESLNTDMTTVRLNKLEDGIYFFKVITNNQIIKIGKVVKQ